MSGSEAKNIVLGIGATLGSIIAQGLGGWDMLAQVLGIMMCIDLITGWILAVVFKNSPKTEGGAFDSHEGWKGLARKGVMILLVVVGNLMDKTIGTNFARDGLCLFFIANEGISILENTGLMGVPYPAFVKNALEALKEKAEKGGEEDGGDTDG